MRTTQLHAAPGTSNGSGLGQSLLNFGFKLFVLRFILFFISLVEDHRDTSDLAYDHFVGGIALIRMEMRCRGVILFGVGTWLGGRVMAVRITSVGTVFKAL